MFTDGYQRVPAEVDTGKTCEHFAFDVPASPHPDMNARVWYRDDGVANVEGVCGQFPRVLAPACTWVERTGGHVPAPAPPGWMLYVRFRATMTTAVSPPARPFLRWTITGDGGDIVAYAYAPEPESAPVPAVRAKPEPDFVPEPEPVKEVATGYAAALVAADVIDEDGTRYQFFETGVPRSLSGRACPLGWVAYAQGLTRDDLPRGLDSVAKSLGYDNASAFYDELNAVRADLDRADPSVGDWHVDAGACARVLRLAARRIRDREG